MFPHAGQKVKFTSPTGLHTLLNIEYKTLTCIETELTEPASNQLKEKKSKEKHDQPHIQKEKPVF